MLFTTTLEEHTILHALQEFNFFHRESFKNDSSVKQEISKQVKVIFTVFDHKHMMSSINFEHYEKKLDCLHFC